MVPEPVAREITRQITIPTIGIGAGAATSGQARRPPPAARRPPHAARRTPHAARRTLHAARRTPSTTALSHRPTAWQ